MSLVWRYRVRWRPMLHFALGLPDTALTQSFRLADGASEYIENLEVSAAVPSIRACACRASCVPSGARGSYQGPWSTQVEHRDVASNGLPVSSTVAICSRFARRCHAPCSSITPQRL